MGSSFVVSVGRTTGSSGNGIGSVPVGVSFGDVSSFVFVDGTGVGGSVFWRRISEDEAGASVRAGVTSSCANARFRMKEKKFGATRALGSFPCDGTGSGDGGAGSGKGSAGGTCSDGGGVVSS